MIGSCVVVPRCGTGMSPNWSAPAPAPAQVRSSSFPPRQLPSSLLPGPGPSHQPPATHQQFPCCWLVPVEPRHYAGPPRDHVFTAQQSTAARLGLFIYYVIRFWGLRHPLPLMSSCSHLLGYPLVVQNG